MNSWQKPRKKTNTARIFGYSPLLWLELTLYRLDSSFDEWGRAGSEKVKQNTFFPSIREHSFVKLPFELSITSNPGLWFFYPIKHCFTQVRTLTPSCSSCSKRFRGCKQKPRQHLPGILGTLKLYHHLRTSLPPTAIKGALGKGTCICGITPQHRFFPQYPTSLFPDLPHSNLIQRHSSESEKVYISMGYQLITCQRWLESGRGFEDAVTDNSHRTVPAHLNPDLILQLRSCPESAKRRSECKGRCFAICAICNFALLGLCTLIRLCSLCPSFPLSSFF